MFRKPAPPDEPERAQAQPPPAEPDNATMPATFGSRLRAREAQQTAQEPPAMPPPPESPPGRAPDVTRWIVLGGAGIFVILFLAAVALLVVARVRNNEVLPTPLNPEAPTTEPPTAAVAAATEVTPEAPTLAPTELPTPAPVLTPYVVQDGDTLTGIAAAFGVPIQAILDANNLTDPNSIVVGQELLIPIPPTAPPPPTAEPTQAGFEGTPVATASADANLPRSIYEGDLPGFYPLTLSGPRVTIHYQPGSFTDRTGPDIIEGNAEAALALIEKRLGVTYTDPLDIYLAGALFAAPDQALRGRAFSTQFRAFVLYDGSGNPDERRYMLAHEMTHVIAWHTYGVPSTVMLSEGLASYSGQSYMEQGGFIPYTDFCRALQVADRLPSLTALQNNTQAFLGHIRALYNYYTAACFVNFLFERSGPETFAALYPTSNYSGNYGAGLGQLEIEFQQSLKQDTTPLNFDANDLVSYYDEVQAGYDRLLSNPNPDMDAYYVLDAARLAVMAGDFETARAKLDEFEARLP